MEFWDPDTYMGDLSGVLDSWIQSCSVPAIEVFWRVNQQTEDGRWVDISLCFSFSYHISVFHIKQLKLSQCSKLQSIRPLISWASI